MSRPTLAAPAALVLALSGCSFVAINRLPGDFELGDVPDCTESLAVPAIDAVAAVMTGASAVVLHSTSRTDAGFQDSAWVVTGAALGFIVAAAYGSHQIIRCRTAQSMSLGERPHHLHDDEPTGGAAGARCKSDKDCEGDLVCDEPMHTCVPVAGRAAPDPLDPAGHQ